MIDKSKVVSLTVELIQCFVEQVWYHRYVYPPESFDRARSFQLPVYTSRHPDVKQYVKTLAVKWRDLLERGRLNRVFVEIYRGDSSVVSETYAVSLTNSPLLEALSSGLELSDEFKMNVLYAEFQAFLYSVINELQTAEKFDTPSTFKVLISADNSVFNQLLAQDWTLHKTQVATSTPSTAPPTRIHEFRQLSLPYLNIKGFYAEHLPC
ncbi:hypothetical protein OGAPHI_001784 [Ogataea philodendri]|uniref:HORMA domain-containing protein n=1 Tax=Ogataea philodendri TaxID=1378263 RepID=A0A9P8T7C6_9ASCO|nr:uncharacterized protein OGAPHI_001784 [Ogataea philodendri]KAH3668030.1 hypothetical protein OGAPHI_001784 [Ogataea philodendri]